MELKKATPIKVLMENAAEEFPPGCDPGLVAEYKEKMTRMCEAAEHELNETFSIMKGIVLERSNIIRVLREGGNDPGATAPSNVLPFKRT
jgi:hypothetical protein